MGSNIVINKNHPDYDMEIYLMRGIQGGLYIIQDRPFSAGILSWVEYDHENGMLNFIMDDGDIRDFGMPISPEFAEDLVEYKNILIALIQNSLYVDGAEFPLIVHGGH